MSGVGRNETSIEDAVIWQKPDYTRVPYLLYHDPRVYQREQERIFRGNTWLYVGLEAEIPNPGDFRTTYLGDVPVVFNRAHDGEIHVFVNRCAHRGSTVVREAFGNRTDHTCIYHRWSYDLAGNLIGVPFQRGVDGKGGVPADFDKADHGLEPLTVENFHGVIFATFSGTAEPLQDYLGPAHTRHIARLMNRPVTLLGYQRQTIYGNWKFYNENVRDQYHGTLLHEFQTTFAIVRVTQECGADLDRTCRHSLTWAKEGTDEDASAHKIYEDANVREGRLRLKDDEFINYVPEYEDGVSISICSVFPNAVFQQIRNSLAARQIRTKGVGAFELLYTLYGYADDSPEMTRRRLMQSNMIGPAGLISMEDGEAVEIAHRSSRQDQDRSSVLEMGGGGEIITDIDFMISEIPIRGFWSHYAEIMGFSRRNT